MNQHHLIVFGRYPKPGKTKTRLSPALGRAGAASLQRRLTEQTIVTARRCADRSGARLIFCHDGGNKQKMARWLGAKDIRYMSQVPGELGRRMFLAIITAFGKGAHRVVLVGTDIPGLTSDILEQAFDSLKSHDLVLGPSIDGGYWLVGMTSPKDIFKEILWSRPDVLKNTLALARKNGMRPYLLDPLTDLDTPEDLIRETGHKLSPKPYLSVIIPTLNEAQQISSTITAATTPDAELLVSDGGSTDRTVDLAESLGAHIVSGGRGRAAQQNLGAAAARGEVLLFLHADTRVPNNYVDHIFETLMDRRVVLGAFHFDIDIHTPVMRSAAFCANLRARWLNLPYGEQGMFMYKVNFDATGGFPNVPIAEDLYLVRSMARKGRISLARAAVVASGRRWQRLGPIKTTLVNTFIDIGCLAGISPERLATLFHLPTKKTRL